MHSPETGFITRRDIQGPQQPATPQRPHAMSTMPPLCIGHRQAHKLRRPDCGKRKTTPKRKEPSSSSPGQGCGGLKFSPTLGRSRGTSDKLQIFWWYLRHSRRASLVVISWPQMLPCFLAQRVVVGGMLC